MLPEDAMRFLFIHQNFPGQYIHVAAALVREGHQVVALTINRPTETVRGVRCIRYTPGAVRPPAAGDATNRGLAEWETKVARGAAAADAMRKLRAAGFQPDVIAAHPGWGEALFAKDVFPTSRLVVYAEYFYGGEGSDTDFDPEFKSQARSAEYLRLKNTHLLHALSACDAAVSPTRFQRDRHPEWARRRIEVIHDGIDTDRFRPNPSASVTLKAAKRTFSAGDELVTFVARQLEPYRGYHTFMRSLPLLQQLRPNAHVVIVGGSGASYGAEPPTGTTWRSIFLKEVARGVDKTRVHFVGRLEHHTLTQLLQVSAAHVYLTYPFVLSWSLLEAMSIGCLVIGSKTAPVQEVIEHGRNGLLTDFFDNQALARCVAEALTSRDRLNESRKNARELVRQKFDLTSNCLPSHLAMLRGESETKRTGAVVFRNKPLVLAHTAGLAWQVGQNGGGGAGPNKLSL